MDEPNLSEAFFHLIERTRTATVTAVGLVVRREIRCLRLPEQEVLAVVHTSLRTAGGGGGIECRRVVESDGVRLISETRIVGPFWAPARVWIRDRLENERGEVEQSGWKPVEPSSAMADLGLLLMLDPIGSLIPNIDPEGSGGATVSHEGGRTLIHFQADMRIEGGGISGTARTSAEVDENDPSTIRLSARGLIGPVAFELTQVSGPAEPIRIVDPSPSEREPVRSLVH